MLSLLLFEFPSFNFYSTPLLVLVLQAYVFAILLLHRFFNKKYISSFILSLVILITGYQRTTYTIGFMDWYDTYRNTKINYWLIPLTLAVGPLLFFYVKSITTSYFRFRKRDGLHFIPVLIFIVYKIVIFVYDASLPGFEDTQNGFLKIHLDEKYIQPLVEIIENLQMLLYFAFTFQLYYTYKRKIQDYFSNTYALELNWIRNFLFVYAFLFLYKVFENVVGNSIIDLHWTQRWWYEFFSAIAILYIGIKGYFTDTNTLKDLNLSMQPKQKSKTGATLQNEKLEKDKVTVENFMRQNSPFLNPDLNLTELSKMINISVPELSDIINSGFQKNFNDFINSYRVTAVQKMLENGKQKQLSLLGIAHECGFNSKATFNRVFKKLTSLTPSEYLQKHYRPD